MPRRLRALIDNACYHLTHRCHDGKFLFKYEVDRKKYIKLLREANNRFDVDVLNYIITSNHTHQLVYAKDSSQIPAFMQFLEGEQGQKYNMKKKKRRKGAFWSYRYFSTLIENGYHLGQCLFYIDLNMVRAGVVKHPSEWPQSGHLELAGIRKRYRIINQKRLLQSLMMSEELFLPWYTKTLNKKLQERELGRAEYWRQKRKPLAIGSRDWIKQIAKQIDTSDTHTIIRASEIDEHYESTNTMIIKDEQTPYSIDNDTWLLLNTDTLHP